MLRIINLLNQKNHYLEKFYSLNENELVNFASGNFDTIESFYQMRDKILHMIKFLDHEIERTQGAIEPPVAAEIKTQVRGALKVKDEYVSRILAQDLEILTCIESAKSNIIRELQDLKKAKAAMVRYKSGRIGSRRLDEEA